MRRAKILALFFFCLTAAHRCAAQQPATPPALTGLVRTSEGTPVPGASVRLINNDTDKIWLSWTEESGKFEFPQIAPGHYRIEANQLGFVQSTLTIEVAVVPPGPIPVILRVATLAELSATPGNPASNKPSSRSSAQGNGQNNAQSNSPSSAPNRRGPGGPGTGQLPAGVANAIREGLAGGFEQTDLTGEGTNAQSAESNGPANAGPQAEPAFSNGANSNATSDSFLLQGTVGQSLAANGPAGFGETGEENRTQLRAATDAANRADVSIYSLDSRGLFAAAPGGDTTVNAATGNSMFTGASATSAKIRGTRSRLFRPIREAKRFSIWRI